VQRELALAQSKGERVINAVLTSISTKAIYGHRVYLFGPQSKFIFFEGYPEWWCSTPFIGLKKVLFLIFINSRVTRWNCRCRCNKAGHLTRNKSPVICPACGCCQVVARCPLNGRRLGFKDENLTGHQLLVVVGVSAHRLHKN
jgi:hypothetical protein